MDHDTTVLISEDYENELSEENLFVMRELAQPKGQLPLGAAFLPTETFNKDYIRQLLPFKHLYAVNPSLFKTPQELVIVSHEPERSFLFRLIEDSKYIASWAKSPDSGFYSLEYEYWKGGKDRVRRSFNPDFFIRINIREYLPRLNLQLDNPVLTRLRLLEDTGIEELILAVEIKSDDNESDETRAKDQYGADHFGSLNRRLRELNPIDVPEEFRNSIHQQYLFYMLRPKDFPGWFSRLRNGMLVFDVELKV